MIPKVGLSFEQAPPLSLPLRFFLTAPLFLLAAALLVVVDPDALASRWSPSALALTHAVTLGFLAMVMLGALLQMLPVAAGSPLPWARRVARTTHVALTVGTATLGGGFLMGEPQALGAGAALLLVAFSIFIVAATASLARAAPNTTVSGMRHAVFSLMITVALGVTLALMQAGWLGNAPEGAGEAHIGFGLIGWVLLLVIGVAYQVVPMFQITPAYAPWLSRWLTTAMLALLLLRMSAPPLSFLGKVVVIDAALAAGMLLFALATLRLQARRRRKLPDITLDYWRLGMAGLVATVVAWTGGLVWPAWAESDGYPMLLGVLFLGGFAISVVVGMLYKIVPFLAWFHLQSQLQAKAGTIPNMKQMIGEGAMRLQFRLHFASLVLLVAALRWPHVLHIPAGTVVALSSLLLLGNLAAALQRYVQHGGRMA